MAASPKANGKSVAREASGKSKSSAQQVSAPQEMGEAAYGSGKPDKAIYDVEQNKLRSEIDVVQAKFASVLLFITLIDP
jgi:hypothetical protein